MTRRRRSALGLSLVQLLVSTTLLAGVMGAAMRMVDASRGLSQSSDNAGIASGRANKTLDTLADVVRHGSLATMQHLDGSNFGDGTTDMGFRVRRVTGFNGVPLLGPFVAYRFDRPAGAAEGQVIRQEGALQFVLARGVTAFSVSRAGNVFTMSVSAGSGPDDDRRRTANASVRVTTRNP